MGVSVNTPVLDKEILKLRRALGDVYDSSGNLITLDTTHNGGGNIYVGNTNLISTWTSGELIDAYNTACVKFIEYLTRVVDKSIWSNFIKGYIVHLQNVSMSSGKVNVDSVNPKIWTVVDAALPTATDLGSVAIEVSPSNYFASKIGAIKTRANQLLFTQFFDGTNNVIQFINYGSATSVNLVYVKQHIDFVHDSASPGDVTVFTQPALERIRIIAEKVAQRYRSQDVKDLPEFSEKMDVELDMVSKVDR